MLLPHPSRPLVTDRPHDIASIPAPIARPSTVSLSQRAIAATMDRYGAVIRGSASKRPHPATLPQPLVESESCVSTRHTQECAADAATDHLATYAGEHAGNPRIGAADPASQAADGGPQAGGGDRGEGRGDPGSVERRLRFEPLADVPGGGCV